MKKFWLKTMAIVIIISMLLSVNTFAHSLEYIDVVLNSGDVVEEEQYYVGRSEENHPNYDPNFKDVNKVTFNAFGSEPIIVKNSGFSGCIAPCTVNEIVFNGTGDIIIGSNAFAVTNITDLNLPSNIKFEDGACDVFSESKVKNVTIGCSMCESMFYGCNYLENVTFTADNDINEIPKAAFELTVGLKKIEIPSSVKKIGDSAFDLSTVSEIKFNEGLETIGNLAFNTWGSFEKITLPSTVKSIGEECFNSYKPYLIELNDGLERVGKQAFICNFANQSVKIPASVTEIGEKAFGYSDSGKKAENFTIYGYRGTAAETYANENGFTFIPLDSESSVMGVTYTPSWSSVNDYSFSVDGRPLKLQVIEATGATRTFSRHASNVVIKAYNEQGNEVHDTSADLAYEVWTVKTRLTPNSSLKIHAKYDNVWEDQTYDFSISTLYSDTTLKSAELAETSGKQSAVGCKIVTGSGVNKVRIEYEDGMTTTVNSSMAVLDETNMTYTYNLSVKPRHIAENSFKVYIKTPTDGWKYATTLTYTVE